MSLARAHQAWKQLCLVVQQQSQAFRRMLAGRVMRRKRRAWASFHTNARDERVYQLVERSLRQQHLIASFDTNLIRRALSVWVIAYSNTMESRRREERAANLSFNRLRRLQRHVVLQATHGWKREIHLIAGARYKP